MKANEAWLSLFEKYNILNQIKETGYFHIKANQIKEFREPRLMAKWDCSSSLPPALKNNKINILPTSYSSYILSDFILYQEIPELKEHIKEMSPVDLPQYESLDVENIKSEAIAINVLILSGILDDFLQSADTVATFSGRMGTGNFDFEVNSFSKVKRKVHVENAQCEIDGGFENDDSVIIIEAKNVVHEDFHIRQLYYPYRLWLSKVNKPIRLIFSIYSNKIFRLFEYKFENMYDYSSIRLVKSKNYSLQDTTITLDDLIGVRNSTPIITNDNQTLKANKGIPFIQADSLDRIISLLEHLYNNPMTKYGIADLMEFDIRQSDYYYNAGKYLGLFKKKYFEGNTYIELTTLGSQVYKMEYKDRQLKIVSLILKHQIFADFFDFMINNGIPPQKKDIENTMRKYNVCNEGQISRRASSVQGWLRWVFNLVEM